jgi:hypothetical protein
MVDTSSLSGYASGYANTVFNAAMIIGGLFIIGAILFVVIKTILTIKKHNYKVIIYEIDGAGKVNLTFDTGGIYVDGKTKNKRFYLRKYNVGLEPDNVPYIKGDKGKRYVFLRRSGLKNFQYVSYENIFQEQFGITVSEEDVNWAINTYEKGKSLFGSSLLMQLLPYIGIALMGVFILGMLVVLFQRIGELGKVAEAFAGAADSFNQAVSTWAKMNNATIIKTGAIIK